ncbi:ribonuclease P [Roseivivax halodurans JCM 10272]|uniref:Ribonuclease P protein component n=1 Tax=Roseivivax halodurans JCM 10272 TaxID=1449350 RepID=X7EIF6_9RHOB|nr:ribonuclease P protein component [Roseivivax halodurans]ETX14941.1 ribonuclease P [Roseivivax halodurans JCM 10272]
MTPPEAPESDCFRSDPAASARPRIRIETLARRPEFLAAARADKQGTKAMLVQARHRGDGTDVVRVGFTCSKKVGNAVARNRAKRRLREAARLVLTENGRPGFDYVLIGKPGATAERPFDALQDDLVFALNRLHARSSA